MQVFYKIQAYVNSFLFDYRVATGTKLKKILEEPLFVTIERTHCVLNVCHTIDGYVKSQCKY